jgi:FkbM family methyltransferase
MFNNCNANTNGELYFFNKIKSDLSIVFDVGCRNDSLFRNCTCDVHYFDPNKKFMNQLKHLENKNSKSFFNDFGLSNKECELNYFDDYQSFVDRSGTTKKNSSVQIFKTRTAKSYVDKNNIDKINFLKIDTEGFEFNVIKGFGERLNIVQIIQFEYGGTFKDAGISLLEIINYLKEMGFHSFSYLNKNGMTTIENFEDHYQYSNIVCFNKTFNNDNN